MDVNLIGLVDVEMAVYDGTRIRETSMSGQIDLCETDGSQEPHKGMVFESEEASRAYYDDYTGRVGFITRVFSSRKSERDGTTVSRGLGCTGVPENKKSRNVASQKRDRRRDCCTAMILLKRDMFGRWRVRKFVKDHNHPLGILLQKRRQSFDEKDKRIQELTAELRVKKRLSAAYREQLVRIMKDVENHNEHISSKVQVARDRLKELDVQMQEIKNHKQST